MRILSIDPSIVNVGVAFILDGKYESSHTFRTKPTESRESRLSNIQDHFRSLKAHQVDAILIEYPDSFIRYGNTAATNLVSLQMLHVAIGAIFAAMRETFPAATLRFVTVREWKGKKGKQEARDLARHYAGEKLNEHESDALVMGIRIGIKSKLGISSLKA